MPPAHAACLESFLRIGHPIHLYCYTKPTGIPSGVTLYRASDILSEDKIFLHSSTSGAGTGSVAGFADMFRYKLLYELGGYWTDTDMFCLRSLPQEEIVIAQAGDSSGAKTANNCLLRLPAGHPLAMQCFKDVSDANKNSLKFGDSGPKLVQKMMAELHIETGLFPVEAFCPLNWGDFKTLAEPGEIPEQSFTIHLWNECWRRDKMDIPWPGPEGSVLYKLSKRLTQFH